QERAVVVAAVLRPWPGLSVVPIPGLRADAPELVHVLARRRDEAGVQTPRDGMAVVGVCERELSAPHRVVRVATRLLDADRAQHRVVEELRGSAVRRADRDVIEHVPTMPTP